MSKERQTWHDLEPIKHPLANKTLLGGPIEKFVEKTGPNDEDVSDLAVIDDGVGCTSTWLCKSWIWRLAFLFTGKINVRVLGRTHPPISVVLGEFYREAE